MIMNIAFSLLGGYMGATYASAAILKLLGCRVSLIAFLLAPITIPRYLLR